MKRILLTWELGGGLGHLIHIRSLAERFLEMGHEVYAALMDSSRAGSIFSGMDIKLLQAPFRSEYRSRQIIPPMCFSQLMNNNGFSSRAELEGLVKSWRTLYELVQPDVVCFDYCPAALVAARDLDCLKVTIGVGFSSPPPSTPFGVFTDSALDTKKMLDDDKLILENTNQVLEGVGADALESLDQLFYDKIKTCFLSLPEFDHYCARESSLYYGPVLSASGSKPKWPKNYKKKVYVYVKQFPGIVQLLQLFAKFHTSFIVYTNNVPDVVLRSCDAPNISYFSDPLDLSRVSKEADLAIVNAGHTTLCQFVLAGVPVLMIPLQMEQQMLSLRIDKQRLGWIADTENKDFFHNVESLLTSLKNGLPIQQGIRRKYARANFTELQIEMCNEIASTA